MVNRKNHAIFSVNYVSDLKNIIIPYFIKYPLLTYKKIDFLLFKTVIELMSSRNC